MYIKYVFIVYILVKYCKKKFLFGFDGIMWYCLFLEMFKLVFLIENGIIIIYYYLKGIIVF